MDRQVRADLHELGLLGLVAAGVHDHLVAARGQGRGQCGDVHALAARLRAAEEASGLAWTDTNEILSPAIPRPLPCAPALCRRCYPPASAANMPAAGRVVG
ncbi:hypothetical protein ACFQZC_05490 [Streptacidiphilus monticola]